jgi:serine/threonine protein kinase
MAAAAAYSAASSSSMLSAASLPPAALATTPILSTLYLVEPLKGTSGDTLSLWRAVHRSSGEVLCVKVVAGDLGSEEAALLAALPPHPCIVPFRCCWRQGSETWLALRCLDMSLAELLAEMGGPLPEALVAQIMVLALRGLQHIHSHGICHRDIKPSNIVLSSEGGLCLSDFGASVRFLGGTATPIPLVGSPLYLAPEVTSRAEAPTNPLMDIWALGICCLELCGHLPFASMPLITAIFTSCTAPPPQLPPAFPASHALRDFLDKMLQRDPLHRSPPAHLLCHPFLATATALVDACEGLSPALSEALDQALPGVVSSRREAMASAPRVAFPFEAAAAAAAAALPSTALPSATLSSRHTASTSSRGSAPLLFSTTPTTTHSAALPSPGALPAPHTASASSASTSLPDFMARLPCDHAGERDPSMAALEARYAARQEELRREFEAARAAHLRAGRMSE